MRTGEVIRSLDKNRMTTIIGLCAAFLTTAAFVPQAIKTFRTGKADDFAWGWLVLLSVGLFLWLVYGLLKSDAAIISANTVTLALVVSIAIVKARSGNAR